MYLHTHLFSCHSCKSNTGFTGRSIDIVSASNLIDGCQQRLTEFRKDIDKYHNDWFQDAVDLAAKLNTEPSVPRKCGRQANRRNHPSSTPSEHFKRTVTIPFLGALYHQLFYFNSI
jgi:hypothetical protein